MDNIENKNIRINKFDNLKGFAIILIVLGHFINFTNDNPLDFFHNFFHLIHLPIFFFVAGYFSKISLDQPEKAFKRLLIPYFIFCLIYWIFKKFILIQPVDTPFLYPSRGFWFLISLFTMKMMLPIINKFRYPVLFSFICALLIGFFDFKEFALSRTICYLPVFLIGFYYTYFTDFLSKNYQRVYAFLCKKDTLIIISVITLMLLGVVSNYISFDIILLKNKYASHSLFNIFIRAVILCLGITFTLIINQWMVNSYNFLTKIGKNSMAVYVLHIFMIVPIWKLLNLFYSDFPLICSISACIFAFIVVYVLSRDWVTIYLNKFINVFVNLIYN